MSLAEIKEKYLKEALARPIRKFGVELSKGRFSSLSDSVGFHVERCDGEVTAKVEKKYLRKGFIQEEIPIEVIKKPQGFLGKRQLYTFTTPQLGKDNLKVEVLETPLIGKVTVKFKVGQNFAVKTEEIKQALYQSSDGRYYAETNLPELLDDFCLDRYINEVKIERNARISDTDKYVQLTDITIQTSAGTKRRGLTEQDRQALFDYRRDLKDLPEQQGFPFIDYPEFPESLSYELEAAVNSRTSSMSLGV